MTGGSDYVGGPSLEGVTPTLTYYSGTSATGTGSSSAPTTVGTYTVLASFAGSTDYTSGVASTTFTISQAAPSVSVADASGALHRRSGLHGRLGQHGKRGSDADVLLGHERHGHGSSSAPTTVGTYTVLASFAGSTDYTSGTASTTFTIGQAAPTVSVTDGGGTYSGAGFAAGDTVSGVGSDATAAVSLESVAPTLTYYAGTSATGSGSSSAPTTVGTYTVLASFAGSTDYTSASASTTFTISQADPTQSRDRR